MPEYLAPGVYVEETSFRAKSIEGVSTSTAGFVGPARFGPISGEPELLTSFGDFQRIYGGLDDLALDDTPQPNYLAHAVRAFFEEGGKRLYVVRTFNFGDAGYTVNEATGVPAGYAALANTDNPALSVGSPIEPLPETLTLIARFPGLAGRMRATFTLRLGANALVGDRTTSPSLTRLQDLDLVVVRRRDASRDSVGNPQDWTGFPAPGGQPTDGLFLLRRNTVEDRWELKGDDGDTVLLADLRAGLPDAGQVEVRPLTVTVEIERPKGKVEPSGAFESPELIGEFGFDPRSDSGLTTVFSRKPPTRYQQLTIPFAIQLPETFADTPADEQALVIARSLLGSAALDTLRLNNERPNPTALARRAVVYQLVGGSDGALPNDTTYAGDEVQFQDFVGDPLEQPKNGLLAFEGVEDISIVAAPGYSSTYGSSQDSQDNVLAIQGALINHCEKLRYRIAVLDTPPDQLVSGALDYRNKRSSKYAALYYPWIVIPNPLGDGRLKLPPSGFVAGIYARNDVDHAVFKAPANEVVRSAIDFEQRLKKAHQEVLNPEGVNCFRFFPGRGFLLWGARTISDDPEWKYVNVRRYFAYLEHSIDRGTQWVVFENNSEQLWGNVRRTIEDFLFNEWKMGALLGTKPEEAYFVRCDRSTMTQNDLDNGRLVCLIGVAVVKPAEFVIFRIGQFTASSNR